MPEDDTCSEFFLNKDYKSALDIMEQDSYARKPRFYRAFLYLQNKMYEDAFKAYDDLGWEYQKGFCMLLQGNQDLAKEIWYRSQENSAVLWGRCLLGVLEGRITHIPSFLQIRNYLEMTLFYFFEANQVQYAENLISAKEFWAECNIESYKFIGRVLAEIEGYKDIAEEYLKKAIEVLPQDYEAYYLLGLLYLEHGNEDKSKSCLGRVLEINEHHKPTQDILYNNF